MSIRFVTFCPPFVRGLNGANKGLASAYICWYVGSNRSRFWTFALWGVALLLGNGGKAQSMLDGKSGEGGAIDRGNGVVTLRFIWNGDFGGTADRGARFLGSFCLFMGNGSRGRNG